MENVCRLCASVKPPDELIYGIDDQYFNFEQKLIDCCRWKMFDSYEYVSFPRLFCDDCFRKLENSWEFAESVARAQEQFLMHMVEIKPAILIEIDSLETPSLIENQNIDAKQTNDQTNGIISESSFEKNDFIDIKYALAQLEAYPNVTKDPTDSQPDNDEYEFISTDEKKKNCETLSEDVHEHLNFLELLSDCDKNADGTVTPEAILRLNLDTWSVIQAKCYVCNEVHENNRSLISHFQQNHSNNTKKYMCTICDLLFSKRSGVFRHVTTLHRPYLQYWFVFIEN